jgi:hypothetical protein
MAKTFTMALPIPLPPPVTIETLFWRLNNI